MKALTIFTVYRQGSNVEAQQGLWGNDDGGWDRFFMTIFTNGSSTGAVAIGTLPPYNVQVTNAGVPGETKLLTAVYDYKVASSSTIYFDGVAVQSVTDNTDSINARPSFYLGWDGDNNTFDGDIAEVVVYNRKLSLCEIQQVNRYLGTKYGYTYSTVSITPSGSAAIYPGNSVTLTASTTGPYQWLKNGAIISGATAQTYSANAAGNYRVIVNNGCSDTSSVLAVTQATMPAPGHALNFAGGTNGDDYVDLGDIPATSVKTMECWVKFNDMNGSQELMNRSITGSGIELLVYNNNLAFFCMDGTNNSSVVYNSAGLVTGRWYHVAATWNGTDKNTMKLYLDGKSVGDLSIAGTAVSGVNNNAPSFKLGNWSQVNTPRYFNGAMDEVRIWSTERSQAQLQASMYSPLSLPQSGLLAYYMFDNGAATANGNNAGRNTVYDYSGNNRTGTMTNFALSGTTSNWTESYAMVHPVTTSPSTIYSSGFTANWTAPAIGTVLHYLLDVATDTLFANKVSGYDNRNVGNVTSFNISGLSNNTKYYYRVTPVKTGTDGNAGPSAVLSVTTANSLDFTLISFEAHAQAQQVQLDWKTATEKATLAFEIERSSNGAGFTVIGRVVAAGNATEATSYQFNDVQPVKGLNLYRLKMINADGTWSYSPVRNARFQSVLAGHEVFPVPAQASLTLRLVYAPATTVKAYLYDLHGRVVKQMNINQKETVIDIKDIAAGQYLLVLSDGSSFKVEKI
ncbi:MAG: T9SS type A sorting domain-containing protein [Sphingobacteriales bacterium]|nr:MAG: T9SS type A sorting domain-containing protein [Sphingobacteriales bacterium]